MRKSLIQKHNELNEAGQVFALAQIVRRVNPSSGKPGDKAIITSDGSIHGWIGGGCTRGIVLKESLLAIQEKKARLVSIRPGVTQQNNSYSKTYTMTCQSGGEVDVFIEPVIPNPMLTIFGSSHIARALTKLSMAMGYSTTLVLPDINHKPDFDVDKVYTLEEYAQINAEVSKQYIIVSTQGEGDLEALKLALNTPFIYFGFIASRIKAAGIFRDLNEMGISFDQLGKIQTPAGLDINAKSPEEVAISILAGIIKDFRTEDDSPKEETSQIELGDDYYLNPVCNIPVQKSTAKHIIEHGDQKVYFCCNGCKVSFENNPSAYLETG